jgi:hypothetical protein
MTEHTKEKGCRDDIDEVVDRLDKLLVTGLGELRSNRIVETLLILQEALATAEQLPKKKEE